MKSINSTITILCVSLWSFFINAQTVSNETMQHIYEEIKTPYKYGLVLVPNTDNKKIDCPTIFREGEIWYMSYIVFNGRGYETWLAKSLNLLDWETIGRLMSFNEEDSWDKHQAAGYMALVNTEWGGNYRLEKHHNKYWMSYFGGNTAGYEAGTLSISLAFTKQHPTKAFEWERFNTPVLTPADKDAGAWEQKTLFKSTVIEDTKRLTGYRYAMFYNALGTDSVWTERIGIAFSNNMKDWHRYEHNPVLDHSSGITGDAYLQRIDNLWVMFYFGYNWKDCPGGAFNNFACSYDLLHWTDWKGEHLLQPSEPYDNVHAHKSCVIKWKGIVYHFYCAVNKKDQRGIAVATSKDLGKSSINFID